MSRFIGLSVVASALAAVAFWATLITDPLKTEAETMVKYDVAEALKAAPGDAPVQDAGVIACTYILTGRHRCD